MRVRSKRRFSRSLTRAFASASTLPAIHLCMRLSLNSSSSRFSGAIRPSGLVAGRSAAAAMATSSGAGSSFSVMLSSFNSSVQRSPNLAR